MPPVPAKRTNGWAITGLVFSIIGGILFGLIFGVIGLVKSKTYRSGKVMSVIAIVLSLVWIAPVAYVVPHLIKAADPGCISANANVSKLNDKMAADVADPQAEVADLQGLIKELNSAAAKSKNATARDAMTRLANDFQEMLDGALAGNAPSAAMVTRIDADGKAVDKACGKF
jgi:hypothetical protein